MPEALGVVEGGIAGATIALVLARAGLTITVLEQQPSYRDRVRGEYIQPWGVAEAQHLGISQILVKAGGFFARRIIPCDEINLPHEAEAAARALGELVPGVPGALCVSHPAACLALSQAAETAVATVIRGIGRLTVTPGSEPTVTLETDGVEHRLSCRLIVGADGRSSAVRAQAGVRLLRDEATHLISGMLVDHMPEWRQEDIAMGTQGDMCFFIFPQGGQKLRLYACTALDQRSRYSCPAGPLRFLDDFGGLSCVPCHEALGRATPIGPCATIAGEDTWAQVPFVEGIVLIGDAGGYNGPIIGQGLSLALRDVRLLSEILLEQPEWTPSRLERYGQRRREGPRRMRIVAEFRAALAAQFGPEVAAQRAHFRDRVREDPNLGILAIVTHLGPDRAPAWVFDDLGTINSGTSVGVTIGIRASNSGIISGPIRNTARALSSTRDPNLGDNSSTIKVTLSGGGGFGGGLGGSGCFVATGPLARNSNRMCASCANSAIVIFCPMRQEERWSDSTTASHHRSPQSLLSTRTCARWLGFF